MLDSIMSILAPHHCCGCDKIGSLLCDNCKYNITIETKLECINCHRPTANDCVCGDCRPIYEKAWVVGDRSGVLQRLIGLYKFSRARSAYRDLADLLMMVIPDLPDNTVIVPIPTTPGHIRERGYDHMLLIARYLSKKTGLKYDCVLGRKTKTKQRQASAAKRLIQAKDAFYVKRRLDGDVPYLIIDDVVTTGATIKFAVKNLKKAGAKHVWVAVVARQVMKK